MYDVQSSPPEHFTEGHNILKQKCEITLICIQLRIVSPALHKLPDMYP